MKFTSLCLVLTDKCCAACDFCGFSCGPENKEVMSEDMMDRLILEAKEMGVKIIGFSGGEPFLFPELLIHGVETAHREKLGVTIASNGFWGAWENERIQEALEKLKPAIINFSYDHFHRKYISEEHFFRAVGACKNLKIKCSVHVADFKGELSAGRFIHSLDIRKFGVDYGIYPAYRMGRAANLPQEIFLPLENRDQLICVYDKKFSVLYNGDVYPCCRHEVFQSAMKIGNVKDRALKDVISESKVPMICDVMMKNDRFQSLIQSAKEAGIELSGDEGCSCDYCRQLFGTEAHRALMEPCAEKLYGEMMVRSVLGGKDNVS